MGWCGVKGQQRLDLVTLSPLWSAWLLEASPGPLQLPAARIMELLKPSLKPFRVSAQLLRMTQVFYLGYR